jgi:hypothetical protein
VHEKHGSTGPARTVMDSLAVDDDIVLVDHASYLVRGRVTRVNQ